MKQLNPMDTIIQTSHGNNTYNKKRFLVGIMQGDMKVGKIIPHEPRKLVTASFYDQIMSLTSQSSPCIYNVVYYCGYTDYS